VENSKGNMSGLSLFQAFRFEPDLVFDIFDINFYERKPQQSADSKFNT